MMHWITAVQRNGANLFFMWRTCSAVTIPRGSQRPSSGAVTAAPRHHLKSGFPSLKDCETMTSNGRP